MERCGRMDRCTLFKLSSMRPSLVIWTSRYCEEDPCRCERLKLAEAGKPVPPNLLPNGKLLDVSEEVGSKRSEGG
jgi:hypothetical protein